MILIVSAHSFGQEVIPSQPVTKEDFLQKVKKQKTAGWVLLGGGFTMTVASLLAGAIHVENDPGSIVNDKAFGAETVLFGVGLVSMAASIPFFVSASKNKRKAMAVTGSFKMETTPVIQHGSFVQTSFPAISLKISS